MVLMEALVHQKLVVILVNKRQKFAWILIYNGDNSCLFVNGKKSVSLKKIIKNNKSITFRNQFCLGNISNEDEYVKWEEGNVYDFSFNYDTNDKYDTLNIHNF